MTIHWKAVEQYFTMELLVNPLPPRVKPWVIQSFQTFDSMDRTLKCDHSLELSIRFEVRRDNNIILKVDSNGGHPTNEGSAYFVITFSGREDNNS